MQCKSTVIDYTQLNVCLLLATICFLSSSSCWSSFRNFFVLCQFDIWPKRDGSGSHFQLNLLTIFCILNQKRARNFYSTQFTVMFRMCNAIVSFCSWLVQLSGLFFWVAEQKTQQPQRKSLQRTRTSTTHRRISFSPRKMECT